MPTRPTPRPYQREAIRQVLAYAAEHPTGRLLLVIPPRGGKTLVGALLVIAMAVRNGLRVLWLVHREELLHQAVDALIDAGIPASMIGVIKAGRRFDPEAKVQVASEATLARRDLPEAHLVVTDESHRDTAERRRRIRARYPQAFLLGLTATPKPPPLRDLGEDYDTLLVAVQPSELIHDGYLAVPTVYAPSRDAVPDLRGLRVSDGDYRDLDLEPIVLRREVIDDQIAEWARLHGGRTTITFPVTIAHSRAIVERFCASGVKAVHLDGKTPGRDTIVAGINEGHVPVVSSVAVLTEGTNLPRVKCVLGVRPTLSLTLYVQSMMRCATPWNDVAPRILDVAGNVYRHGLPFADRRWSLRNAESGALIGEHAGPLRRCPSCGAVSPGSARTCSACRAPFQEPAFVLPEPPTDPLHLDVFEPSRSQRSEERRRLVAYAVSRNFAEPEAWADRVLTAKSARAEEATA